MRLENTLKLEKLKNENLEKERRVLGQQLKVQEKEITKLSDELDLLKAETGWTRGMRSNGVSRCVLVFATLPIPLLHEAKVCSQFSFGFDESSGLSLSSQFAVVY